MSQGYSGASTTQWIAKSHAFFKEDGSARYKELLDKAIEIRNFEITQLHARNNFMLIAQAALVAGWVAVSKEGMSGSLLLPTCGAFLSIFQTQMAAGAKFWQVRWELAAKQAEELYLAALGTDDESKVHLFIEPKKGGNGDEARLYESIEASLRNGEKGALVLQLDRCTNPMILRRYSVSRIPIYMSISFYVLWILLLTQNVQGVVARFALSIVYGFGLDSRG